MEFKIQIEDLVLKFIIGIVLTKKITKIKMQKRYVTVSKARKILGKSAGKMTDDEISEVLDTLYECAEFTYHMWSSEQE